MAKNKQQGARVSFRQSNPKGNPFVERTTIDSISLAIHGTCLNFNFASQNSHCVKMNGSMKLLQWPWCDDGWSYLCSEWKLPTSLGSSNCTRHSNQQPM